MVPAIHSSHAQSSWDIHRGLKHRERDPEWPEENVQFTPVGFCNNCTSACLSVSLNITSCKYLTQSDAKKHFCLVLFFWGCRTVPKKFTNWKSWALVAAWPGFFSSTMRFRMGVLCLVHTGFDYRFSCTSIFISSTPQRMWNACISSPRKLRCDIVFQGHMLGAYVSPYFSSINA